MRFLADENFKGPLLKAILKAIPDIDLIRVQDTEVWQAKDPEVLEWAAKEGRIVLTFDVQTMIGFAYARVKAGLPMPGVIEVAEYTPIGQVIDELMVIIGTGGTEDFENQVKYIPM